MTVDDVPPGLDLDLARQQKAEALAEEEPSRSFADLVRDKADIQNQIHATKEELKKLQAIEANLDTVLRDALDKAGSQSIKTEDKVTVSKNDSPKFSVKKDDRDRFIRWLDEIGQGDLAKRAVPDSTLKAFCKEWQTEELERAQAEERKPRPLPAFIQVFNKRSIRVTGIKRLADARKE